MKFILYASIAFVLQCNVQQVDDFVIIKFVSTVLVIKSQIKEGVPALRPRSRESDTAFWLVS